MNSSYYDQLITVAKNNLIMFLYKRNICHILENLSLFCYWATLKWTTLQQILTKMFQCCFLNVETMPMNIRSLNLYFQMNVSFDTTLSHWHWIDIIVSTSFQRYFANVDKHTSVSTFIFNQISTLKQLWFIDVESTWFNQRCFNVVLLMLKQRQ